MKGIPWPVSVYYDPLYAPRKINAATSDGQLAMQFNCTLNGAVAMATADSGASHTFINTRFVNATGITCTPDHRVVELADGSLTVASLKCRIHIRMKSTIQGVTYSKCIDAHVVDLGEEHDLLLGNDWMTREKVDLSFHREQCIIHQGGGEPIPIPIRRPRQPQKPTTPITMLKAKRLQRKGAKLFMVNVIDTGVTPMTSDILEMDDLDITPPGNLPDTVTFPNNISLNTKQCSKNTSGYSQSGKHSQRTRIYTILLIWSRERNRLLDQAID